MFARKTRYFFNIALCLTFTQNRWIDRKARFLPPVTAIHLFLFCFIWFYYIAFKFSYVMLYLYRKVLKWFAWGKEKRGDIHKIPPLPILSYSEHIMDNLRRRAIRTFFRAKSFIFLKVVFCFNLLNPKIGISFAIHSSANELETTFTPSKSKITHSEDSIVAIKSWRTFSPKTRAPRFSPNDLNLNTVVFILQR